MKNKQQILSGWGNFPTKQCTVFRPERPQDVGDIYLEYNASVIARGAGKSYGDAALNREGVILSERLNKFLAFDKEKGIITTQSGVTLSEILAVSVPEGWFLPVIPGTKYVSAGGCFASNVHGKNEYKFGEFASHVASVKLRLPNREVIHCSQYTNPEIFWATAGGMGMTGYIEEISIKLFPISSARMKVETARVKNLEELMEKMRSAVGNSEYMVGWVDHFGTGKDFGRGVFERAYHVKKPDMSLKRHVEHEPRINVPFFMPSFILNKYSMSVYNGFKFASVGETAKTRTKNFSSFFHPLDAIGNWNRLYGRRGFLQYQCLIPEGKDAIENMKKILKTIQAKNLFSFLAVIKYHGPHQGMLSFSKDGFSMALDIINTPAVHGLLDEIDEFLCSVGGRVYLAKDARLKPISFERMYADNLPEWRKIIKQVDPKCKIHSSMARRLGLRGKS